MKTNAITKKRRSIYRTVTDTLRNYDVEWTRYYSDARETQHPSNIQGASMRFYGLTGTAVNGGRRNPQSGNVVYNLNRKLRSMGAKVELTTTNSDRMVLQIVRK